MKNKPVEYSHEKLGIDKGGEGLEIFCNVVRTMVDFNKV